MKRLTLILVITCLAILEVPARPVLLPDSLGVEKKGGKLLVLHRIEQGQTLFSLVRKYKTSIQAIREANPGIGDNVRFDQVVRVPVTTLSRKEEKALTKEIKKEVKEQKREEKEERKTAGGRKEDANSGIHQVETGQTLYSLSTRYGVSREDLRKWNNLSDDQIMIGQALIVSEKAWRVREPSARETPAKEPAPKATTPLAKPEGSRTETSRTSRTDSPKTERPAAPRTLPSRSERPEPAREEPPAEPARASNPEPSTPSEPRLIRPGDTGPLPNPGTNARKIAEIGLAEIIDESDNSNKYLALHRTAPVGTLILVRNDRNNQSIWVKVIGRLPDTSINDKVIVKISARAFEKLSPADRRFRAEVSYLAP